MVPIQESSRGQVPLPTLSRVFETSIEDTLRPFDFVLVERKQKVEVDYLEAVETLADAADQVLRKAVDLVEFMTAKGIEEYDRADAEMEQSAWQRQSDGVASDPAQVLSGVRPRPQRWAYSFEPVAAKAFDLETTLFFTAVDVCRANRDLGPLSVKGHSLDEASSAEAEG
jgi:hypothetical protein